MVMLQVISTNMSGADAIFCSLQKGFPNFDTK